MVINSIYGTAIENLRKRINVILVNNGKVYEKHVSKPSFVSHNFFSKYLAATHEVKLVLTLDKPIHVGFSILDSSKLILYDYHWKAIKRKFDAKLLFTDTDSLIYKLRIFMNIFMKINIHMIWAIIQKIQGFMIIPKWMRLVKWKNMPCNFFIG